MLERISSENEGTRAVRSSALALCLFLALGLQGSAANAQSVDTAPPTSESEAETVVPFEISLFYPVHIFHPHRKVIKGLSLNVVHGATTSVYGVELGGVVNYASVDASGIRVAGAVSYAGNDADGVQIAGFVNYADHDGSGLRLAGLLNDAGGKADGIQVAGMFNHASHRSFGLQLAVMFNWDNSSLDELTFFMSALGGSGTPGTTEHYSVRHVSDGEVGGLQIAGLGNSAMYLYGFQISAIVNRAFRLAEGGQIGALANVAGDLSGFQVAPLNFARDVVGLQIGVLNVARKLKGIQIGVANVAYENPLPFMVVINAGWGSFERDPRGDAPPENSDVELHWTEP